MLIFLYLVFELVLSGSKSQNNIFKAVYSERPLLSIDSSSFFITPISLVVEAINYVISLSKSRYLANLFMVIALLLLILFFLMVAII